MIQRQKKEEKNKDQESRDLEETLKERLAPLLEETMEKSWGLSIPQIGKDITDKLSSSAFDLYVPSTASFQEAKKKFKEEFLKKELRIHLGNISQLAKKLDLDRRSLHRSIKEFHINVKKSHSEEIRKEQREQIIQKMIKSSLVPYKEIIQPKKIEQFYEDVSSLSQRIAQFLPHSEMTWKQAEQEFEKQFLSHALREHGWKISRTALNMGLRVETLHRKIKKLGLRK